MLAGTKCVRETDSVSTNIILGSAVISIALVNFSTVMSWIVVAGAFSYIVACERQQEKLIIVNGAFRL